MTAKKKPAGKSRVTVADLERRVVALETEVALLKGRGNEPQGPPPEPAPPTPPQANP